MNCDEKEIETLRELVEASRRDLEEFENAHFTQGTAWLGLVGRGAAWHGMDSK